MKVIKEQKGSGYTITVIIAKRSQSSYWTSPPIYGKDNHHYNFEREYLVGRYPMVNTKLKAAAFSRLYKNLWIEVNEEQLRLMKHMIGLNYHKKPYRNYGFFYKEVEELEQLVIKGLAYVREIKDKGVNYHLTKQGVEYVLGKSISDHVYNKL